VGRVEFVSIGWTTDNGSGPRTTVIDLEALRKYCRPERVDDLLDDLLMLCEGVQAQGRPPVTLLRRIR